MRPPLAEDRTARNAISTFIGGFVFAVVGIVILSPGYYSDAAKVLVFFLNCVLILALIVALVRWIGRLSQLGGVAESIDPAEEVTRKALLDLAAEPLLGGTRANGLRPGGHAISPDAPASCRPSTRATSAPWRGNWTWTPTSSHGRVSLSGPGSRSWPPTGRCPRGIRSLYGDRS